MADDKNKLELNIRASINTDTIEQDFKNFDDPTAPLISNTGIERDGGITNIYETETKYTEVGQHIVTDDGKDISIVDSATANYKVIKIDGKPIGQTSSYGVEKQLFIEAADDVFLDTNSYTVCSLIDNVITVTEYDYDQVQLNTRDITFTNLGTVLTFFTSLSFIRYNGIKYSDSLEFALRLGDQIIILQESNPGVTVSVALQSSSVLGTSTINASVVYNNTLVVAGDAGKVGSFDGTAWKNWDGSGTGVGVYNNGDATLGVVGSSNILSLCVYTYLSNTYLVVGGVGGRVGSWNGTSWVIWSSGGLISNNATAISTDTVNCMTQWDNYLVIAGSAGKLASWNGTAWKNYNVAGLSDNATLIGAVAINTILIYTDIEGNPTLVVGGASGRVGSMKIVAGIDWTFRTTTAPGGPWRRVVYGNGLFVAVAVTTSTTAGIATSPDGINWTFRTTTAPGTGWMSVAYGNGLFVAIAYTTSTTAGIATSPDGINWTFRTTTAPGDSWQSITYGNGLFVAVAFTTSTTAGIATSPDGVTWTFQTTTAPGSRWQYVAYGNGLFIALADTTSTTAGIATSPDGINWTFRTTTAPGNNWRSVAYGNGLFVAVAITTSTTAGIATSPDGINWTFRTTTAPGTGWTSVAYGNGLFVAVAYTTSTTAGIATSPDGINWTFRTTTAPGSSGWFHVTYGNGLFVALSATTSTTAGIATSFYGSTSKLAYTVASSSIYPTNNGTVIGANAINAMAQFNNQLVVVGDGGRLGSYDGLSWKNYNQTGLSFYDGYNVRLPSSPGAGWISVTYGNGLFVAVAATTSTTTGIATSPDGTTWTFQTLPSSPAGIWWSVTYGNGLFVAVAYTTSTTAGIATSPDGVTWTFSNLPSAPGGNWYSVAYGNGLFVAVAATTSTTSGIATSPDGVTWTFQTTTAPGGGGWRSVTYGNGLFVAVANTTSTTAGIATSPDGINWTFQTTTAPGVNGWFSVTYGNGLYVAVALTTSTTAGIATSPDGVTWTFQTTTAPGGYWHSVTYGNGLFVAVANTTSTTAGIATSPDGVNWTFQTTISVESGCGSRLGGCFYLNNKYFISYYTSYIDFGNIFSVYKAYTDNATLIGSNAINSLQIFDSKLVVAGSGGRVGSINADTTKNIYTSGTPISSDATFIGANNIRSMIVYNSQLIASGVSSTVNSMSTSGASTPFYDDSGTVVANLLTGFNSLGYLYVYRYENGYYHINLTGNSLNKAYTLNNSTKEINIINCRYSIPQVSNGVTRHIVSSSNTTARPIYDGSSIKCTGLVGYTDFATFSGTVQYPTAAYVLGNGFVLQSAAGFGYSDFTFRLNTSATSIYNYVPQFQQFVSGLYQIVQSNTNTLVNAYGKLTNNLNLTPTKPFEFRVGMINGVQAYLSTAILDGIASDALGTIITNVGEFDDTYSPMIKDDDKILYLYNNKHIITKIGTNITNRIQKVDTNIYKLNSISPLNIVDPSDNSLRLGSMDYNGRMLFTSSTSPTVSTKIASVIQGKYSNSIDVGDKLVTIVSPTANNVEIIGYRVPVVSTSVGDYSVDTYFNDIYSYSTLNDGSELIVSSKVDTIYVATTILPTSLGVEYRNGTAQTSGTTIFLKPLYDGYSIGNDITGNYDSFVLFGQLYLFDGNSIYLATVDEVDGIFSNKTKVTSAIGLKYLAVTSTEAYFYSSFDNSLYTFSGGRDLNKFKRMNRKPIINSGIYSTVDNTLLFDTDTSFIWIRDNIITENIKGLTQTNLKYYSTTDGIIIGNDVSKWQYTYYPLTGSITVPLSIQTSYYGFNLNDKSILSAWVITIYNENKDATNIKGTCYIIDDDTSRQQPINWTINPRDYVDGGYARIRVQPENQRSLGTSLKLETNSKIILVSVVPEFIKGETAVVAKARSR